MSTSGCKEDSKAALRDLQEDITNARKCQRERWKALKANEARRQGENEGSDCASVSGSLEGEERQRDERGGQREGQETGGERRRQSSLPEEGAQPRWRGPGTGGLEEASNQGAGEVQRGEAEEKTRRKKASLLRIAVDLFLSPFSFVLQKLSAALALVSRRIPASCAGALTALKASMLKAAHDARTTLNATINSGPSLIILLCTARWAWISYRGLTERDVGASSHLVLGQRNWWRAVTAVIDHVHFGHLAVNMTTVWNLRGMQAGAGGRGGYIRQSICFVFLTALLHHGVLPSLAGSRGKDPRVLSVGYSGVLFAWEAQEALAHGGFRSEAAYLVGGSIMEAQALGAHVDLWGHLAGVLAGALSFALARVSGIRV